MFNNQSKLSSQYLDKFLELNSKSNKKVLSSHKVKLKKDFALKQIETLKFQRFHNKLFAENPKVLDFKILQFFDIIGTQIQSNKLLKSGKVKLFKSGSYTYFLKFIYFLVKAAFVLLSTLNTNFVSNGVSFFSKKKNLLSFIYFFKHKLLTSFIYNTNIHVKVKLFFFKFFLNYFLFSLYRNLKKYIEISLEKHGGISIDENTPKFNASILTNKNNKSKALSYYEQYVYKLNNFDETKKEINFKINNSKNLLSHRICRKQLYKTKKVLDDKKFSIVLSIIRNYLRSKGVSNPNALKIIDKAIQNVTPLYKITYQKRGRNRIAIAKYLFIKKIRESMGIKWVMGSIPTIRLNFALKHHQLELKIATSFLDTFFHKGVAFAKSKDFRNHSIKGINVLNKGQLLKTTKPFLSK